MVTGLREKQAEVCPEAQKILEGGIERYYCTRTKHRCPYEAIFAEGGFYVCEIYTDREYER
jgi:hypothetical protein